MCIRDRTYVDQAFKILDPEKTTLRYNSEWLLSLNMEGLLKLASNFTVARILERDDFHNRYTSNPVSYTHLSPRVRLSCRRRRTRTSPSSSGVKQVAWWGISWRCSSP